MKKFLFMLVICVSSFIIYTNNVKAEVYTDYKHFTDNYITCSSGYGYCQETLNVLSGHGTKYGDLMFSFLNDPQIMLYGVEVANENWEFYSCDIGTQLLYSDNTTGYTIITAVCPMKINNNGVRAIKFNYDDSYLSQTSFKFTFGDYYTFIVDYNANDYTSILNSINNSISTLNTNLGGKLDNQTTIINNIYNQLLSTNGKLDFANTKLYDIDSKLNDIKNKSSATASNTEEIKNDIKSDNVSGAEGSADDLKNNSAFQDNTGLSGIISMPLTFVNSLTNTCQPINLNIPYMDVDVTIPCMQSVITDKMPLLANLIKIIVNGFIVYRILLDIFQIVRNAKNPEDDRIEVLDL